MAEKGKRVLWLSRHPPLKAQEDTLKSRFGPGTSMIIDTRPFQNAKDIARRFRAGNYDEMVAVAPLSVIQQLCREGLKPLWAEMEYLGEIKESSEYRAGTDTVLNGKHYRFKKFKRVKSVEMVFEDL